MFERDYLMRMLLQLAEGIVASMDRKRSKRDPELAAQMLDQTIGEATDIDGSVLLSLAPESIASILQVSQTDPAVVEYLARSMLLAAEYRKQAGDASTAALRCSQALALAEAYGLDLDAGGNAEAAMEAFLESERGKEGSI